MSDSKNVDASPHRETARSGRPEKYKFISQGSIYRVKDFRLLFLGSAVSKFGAEISSVALPLIAVISLEAGAGQVGALAAMSTVAFLLIGLPAGAWIDRMRRRPIMIVADLSRAALLFSIPFAWWIGILSLPWLFCVVFMCGVFSVLFDISSQSFVPSVVNRDRLLEANSRLGVLDGFTSIAGPSVGGLLVQAIGAPLAVIADAVSYLWSSMCISRIGKREQVVERGERRHLVREVAEGVKFVWSQPVIRALSLTGAITNLSYQIVIIMMPVLFLRHLGLTAGAVGLFLACGGVGSLLGALIARRAADAVGHGRILWIVDIASIPLCLVLPLADSGLMLWVSCIAWTLIVSRNGMKNVIGVSFRQSLTPTHLLGRMSATMRVILFGALTVGAGIAGLVGSSVGVRSALWVGSAGLALTWVPILLSPLRSMRSIPSSDPSGEHV
ncbi:MFS transporter [Streptomyces bikiniensis]|uniref:MFS transporter n=1 Tax=Streptomyces bikiniensis TaxID=1896 RepID=A0ABW8D1C7_STRBI